ncbi:MAG TPA: hypothetical protein VGK94_06040 [Candidatus Polarisedimenticolia bacterium]
MSQRVARVACALLLVAAFAHPAPAQEPPLVSRTYTAHYRGVDEIVALIQPVISDRGSYAVHPKIKSVTVTDTSEILARLDELMTEFDLPPRAVKLVVQLMRAEEGTPQEKPQRRMGVPPSVIQDVTKWGVITPIGSAAVVTAENETGSVALGDEYRVRFEVGSVSPRIGVIRVERFALEKIRRGAEGQPRPVNTILDLVLNLKAGVTTVLGATSSQDSRQALFVSVTATSQEP